jgi:ABC-type transport system involved in cytochrome c biogenesis ATPase subunit
MTLGIEAVGLQLRYRDVTALDDLSFTLPGGRIYGLLGRNRSGKTSLLSVLAGFRKASGGTVLIDGQPVFENPRITRQVCLIREAGDTGDRDERVGEALYTASRLRPGWDGDYADALVDRFEVPRRKKLGELSLGQRSTLGMIFGLAARTPVTLFDESHLGMDAPSRAAFHSGSISGPPHLGHHRTAPGAGFSRSDGRELLVIALALAMVVVTGYGIGFNGVPFVGAVVDGADVPLAGTAAVCLAGLLPGAAVTWALVRDIPIRNRLA